MASNNDKWKSLREGQANTFFHPGEENNNKTVSYADLSEVSNDFDKLATAVSNLNNCQQKMGRSSKELAEAQVILANGSNAIHQIKNPTKGATPTTAEVATNNTAATNTSEEVTTSSFHK